LFFYYDYYSSSLKSTPVTLFISVIESRKVCSSAEWYCPNTWLILYPPATDAGSAFEKSAKTSAIFLFFTGQLSGV